MTSDPHSGLAHLGRVLDVKRDLLDSLRGSYAAAFSARRLRDTVVRFRTTPSYEAMSGLLGAAGLTNRDAID